MARGILGGMVFGGAVSVAAAAGISILLDPPTRPDVAAEAPNRTTAPQAPDKEAASGFGDADLVTEGGVAPVSAPQPEDVTAAVRAGGDTPLVPEAGGAETPSFSNGTSSSETALSALPQNEPVLQAPQAAAPTAPGAELELSFSTEPAQPLAPKVDDPLENVEASTLAAPVAPQTPVDLEAEPSLATSQVDEQGPAQDLARAPESPSSDAAPSSDAPAALPERGNDAAVPNEAAEVRSEPDVSVQDADEPLKPEEIAAIAVPAEDNSALPEVDSESAEPPKDTSAQSSEEQPEVQTTPSASAEDETPENTGSRLSVGRPASSIINRGGEPAQPSPEPATSDTADSNAAVADAPVPSGPPLEAFAAEFDNPDGKPLMSIVLIDGATDLANAETGLTALQSFPYPLSFAVDATAPDAAARMQAYRAAGFEVLAMMNLPIGATPQDAAVNVDAALASIPQAVALIEGPGTGLQTSSAVTDQLISTLQTSGHGIVLQAKGLNSAQKDASRAGVPARIVFRDFDSAGQDARTIRRFLDQAAFRADQEGGVIMMGRLRADTISALLIWGNQERARRVSLSPVSAVLKQ